MATRSIDSGKHLAEFVGRGPISGVISRQSYCFLLATAVGLTTTVAGGQAPPKVEVQFANASFEAIGARRADGTSTPIGWYTGGEGYLLAVDTAQRLDGRFSLRSLRVDTASGGQRFGLASQTLPANVASGRTVRFTGWIRTENITTGYAGLWLRIDAPGNRMLHLDNMQARGPRGTTPWTRYVIELPVDSGAATIIFGALHPGSGTAWFDSLRMEAIGEVRPREVASAPAYAAPSRPAEDFTRLLTDTELSLPPDEGTVPAVDSVTTAWVRANARPIRSLVARDFSDLAFLGPLLEGKRIVQLGESGHGVREFNLAKVRLIQFLHDSLGYDVLAFESSLYTCSRVGRTAARATADELMRWCTFQVWHTDEVLALFEYVIATQHTPRPLVLSGFDVQTSTVADRTRPGFFRRVVGELDSAYAARVYEIDSEVVAAMVGPNAASYASQRADTLVAFYDSLATWIEVRKDTLAARFPDDRASPILARQVARSVSQFVRTRAAGMNAAATELRDRGMADNVDFLLDEMFPGKKVMLWAHNSHIQHRGFGADAELQRVVRESSYDTTRTMGTWIAERRRTELYTIGLFMYRGSAAMNNRVVYPVSPVSPGSLEAILHRAPWKYSYVDLSRARSGAGMSWMSRRISAKSWGINTQTMVPRAEYDGILFIDTTWPPQYSVPRR